MWVVYRTFAVILVVVVYYYDDEGNCALEFHNIPARIFIKLNVFCKLGPAAKIFDPAKQYSIFYILYMAIPNAQTQISRYIFTFKRIYITGYNDVLLIQGQWAWHTWMWNKSVKDRTFLLFIYMYVRYMYTHLFLMLMLFYGWFSTEKKNQKNKAKKHKQLFHLRVDIVIA